MPTNKETKSNLLNEIKYLVLPKIKINKIKGKLWYTFKGMFGKDDFEAGEKKRVENWEWVRVVFSWKGERERKFMGPGFPLGPPKLNLSKLERK